MKFSEFDLHKSVIMAVADAGYQNPTPIQQEAIPEILKARDLLGVAQTGTGKTASFILPMISSLTVGRTRARMPRALILCPTRELAIQVDKNFKTYGKYSKLSAALLIGGVSYDEQSKILDRNIDALIATPGRLLDHLSKGRIMLGGVQILVIDEADRMLDMGFIPDIERIVALTPFSRQTLMFSATMPAEIERLTEKFLTNPARVEVAPPASVTRSVQQNLLMLQKIRRSENLSKIKRDALRAIISQEGDKLESAIVFCNRKRDVSIVARSLRKHGHNAAELHGDLDQHTRQKTLDAFRAEKTRILVASDVAGRGLDISGISHVINFDIPANAEDYVHRIGRTGRAGKDGVAFSIAVEEDTESVERIETLTGASIPRIRIDNITQINAKPAKRSKLAPARNREGKGNNKGRNDASSIKRAKDNRSHGGNKGARKENKEADQKKEEITVGLGDHVPAFLLRKDRTDKN